MHLLSGTDVIVADDAICYNALRYALLANGLSFRRIWRGQAGTWRMLKKIFYVVLGLSIIAAKKSVSLMKSRRIVDERQVDGLSETAAEAKRVQKAGQKDILAQATAGVQSAAEQAAPATVGSPVSEDDLTAINGIGPAYARRLEDAGILTYSSLAQKSPEVLRAIAQVRGQSADPQSWIEQARALSQSG